MSNPDEGAKKQLLGEILVNRKIVNADQLSQALAAQKNDPGYLGEILVKLGFADEKDILVALIVQCNLPYIAIDKYEVDRNVLKLLSKEEALSCQSVPVDKVGEVLSVVMANPLDMSIREQLQRSTKMTVTPFIATRAEINRAIERWYGK